MITAKIAAPRRTLTTSLRSFIRGLWQVAETTKTVPTTTIKPSTNRFDRGSDASQRLVIEWIPARQMASMQLIYTRFGFPIPLPFLAATVETSVGVPQTPGDRRVGASRPNDSEGSILRDGSKEFHDANDRPTKRSPQAPCAWRLGPLCS